MNRLFLALALAWAGPAAAQDPDLVPVKPASIDVHCLYVDETAANGAAWKLAGQPLDPDAPDPALGTSRWQVLEGELDEDGRAEIQFVPRDEHWFTLVVEAEVGARREWSWDTIGAGQAIALGACELSGVGRIEGRILRPDGTPVLLGELRGGGLWSVDAELEQAGSSTRLASSTAHPHSASFTLASVPVGQVTLRAGCGRYGKTPDIDLEVLADRVTVRDIVIHDLESAERRVRLSFMRPRFAPRFDIAAEHMMLVGPEGETRSARASDRRWGEYVFDDVPEGVSELVLDHPAYRLPSKTILGRCRQLSVRLIGSSSIEFTVLSVDGLETRDAQVEVRVISAAAGTTRPLILRDGQVVLQEGLVTGVVPGDYVVAATLGGVQVSEEVIDLEVGERRAVTIDLRKAVHFTGWAVRPDGTPLVGETIRLVSAAEQNDSPHKRILGPNASTSAPGTARWEKALTRTGADGGFSFPLPGPGRYLVATNERSRPRASTKVFTVAPGESQEDIVFKIPFGGTVHGKIELADGFLMKGWSVGAGQSTGGSWGGDKWSIDEDGSFVLGPLPEGEAVLYLYEPRGLNRSHMFAKGSVRRELLGKVAVIENAAVEAVFELPGPTPATVSLDLKLPTEAEVWHRVTLASTKGGVGAPQFNTSGMGSALGPIYAAPGTYWVLVNGLTWGWRHPKTIALAEGERTTLELDVEVYRRRLRLTRAGIALGKMSPLVKSEPDGFVLQGPGRTDEDGWIDVVLGAGRYTFELGGKLEIARTFEWPLEEGVTEIDFP